MKFFEKVWMEEADGGDSGGAGGGSGSSQESNADPGSGHPTRDNAGQGSEPSVQNQIGELTRKLNNAVSTIEQQNETIASLQSKPTGPQVAEEDVALLGKLKTVFGGEGGTEVDPLEALGPAPSIYEDGEEAYRNWHEQRTQILIDRGVQQGIAAASNQQRVSDGTVGFKKANNGAEADFKKTFKLRTNRDITDAELDELAAFTNRTVSPTGEVYQTLDATTKQVVTRRAFTEADIWNAYKLKNHDSIVSEAASKGQSEAARALRDVSDPSLGGSQNGPTDATDFDSMSAMDQAVTLKTLENEQRIPEMKSLIDGLRGRNPQRLREVRQIITNAAELAKDESFGGMRDI